MSSTNHLLPTVDGVVTARELAETVDAIASMQLADGNIPWTPGGHTDPWNLVEAAMALDLGGRHDEARARVRVAGATSSAPTAAGTRTTSATTIEDPTLDTNVTCYVATGAWHHHLVTGDTAYLRAQWPTVEAAIDFALDFQRETGEIAWRGDDPDDGALLTGSSSIHHSLKCALAIAERLGHERPDWELSLGALAIAIAHRPDVFLDKDRWAMDWYYPILGGVLRGYAGRRARRGAAGRRSSSRVAASAACPTARGSPRPRRASWSWRSTPSGATSTRAQLFGWVQFLRAEGGGYWTGANFDDEAFHLDGELYPVEQPTWNSAAVVLAANALAGTGPTAGLFRGERLPEGLNADELLAAGVEIAEERARK